VYQELRAWNYLIDKIGYNMREALGVCKSFGTKYKMIKTWLQD